MNTPVFLVMDAGWRNAERLAIPTISKNDRAFADQLYWRGRVWPSVNYLVYLGLKAYRLDEAAHELAYRSARLFMKEWRLRGHHHLIGSAVKKSLPYDILCFGESTGADNREVPLLTFLSTFSQRRSRAAR